MMPKIPFHGIIWRNGVARACRAGGSRRTTVAATNRPFLRGLMQVAERRLAFLILGLVELTFVCSLPVGPRLSMRRQGNPRLRLPRDDASPPGVRSPRPPSFEFP